MTQDASALQIRDYDPGWPARFAVLAVRAQRAIGSRVLRVEHVGSTAVPGLAAKPVIDLDVVLAAPKDVPEALQGLAGLGYVHEGDLGISGREAFRCPPGEAQHHLYLLVEGAAELRRHVAFRDALRGDAALRDAYAALKRSLAAQYPQDRGAYTSGKSAFIEAVLKGRPADGLK